MSDVVARARQRLEHLSCQEVLHPYTSSCWHAYLTIVISVLRFSLPLYTSLYALPAIVRLKSLRAWWEEVLPSILWSTVYLTGKEKEKKENGKERKKQRRKNKEEKTKKEEGNERMM
jgi:hypothetical protein